ncbi:MAG: alpha/beta hydrolase, partial [Pseudomonadota bacterium]|nr:alpha/beta hydrolase [Pseudomonadota bacterium]
LVASADGGWRLHFDPRIMTGRDTRDADMWAAWNRIDVPVLCLWGVESILLSAATVERMRATGPRAEVYALAGVGHCPGLTSDAEIARIQAFLEGPGLTA